MISEKTMNNREDKNICRVCLDDSVILDWSSPVYGYCNITYRDCFYKYTQLNYPGSETYSSMLCEICSNGLYNIHTLIMKALESHKYFTERNFTNLQLEKSVHLQENVKYTPPKYESILVETFDVESISLDNFAYDTSDGETAKPAENLASVVNNKLKKKVERKAINRANNACNNYEHNAMQTSNKLLKKTRRKAKQKVIETDDLSDKLILDDEIMEEKKAIIKNGHKNIIKEPKVRKKYKEVKTPRMCSICSKILHNKYAVELHEKTHMDNRERNETCKICGLKFYDKRNLYSHKRIHNENREKSHKCEFCDKAFYDKGGLNIHRRIHLGQMIPCTLCSKQFYRQIDLDRHMTSHSATPINSGTKKRSRYFVRCKHCSKSILSTSFKSHTAAHLNEPLMKCSICSKEFFRRASCVLHIKKVHRKTNEEYNNFIILHTKNRISHLFLEQKAEIQFTDG